MKLNNRGQISKLALSITILITLVYFTWWLDFNHAGNIWLYSLLVIGEIYHVWQALGYVITIYDQKKVRFKKVKNAPPVDVLITVCGEPAEIVQKTLEAVMKIDYPEFYVYVLNDGKSANKPNWQEIDELTRLHGATPITRDTNTGAKAGNINNALKHTHSPFFAVFDADHIPEKEFLSRTMGQFEDENLALVQTPQYYENKDDNRLTLSAWEQQELFFGPICTGKNRHNATFWCGTNAVVRRKAIESIGGVPENNIAEDFLASLFMHEKGWKSIYIPEILAKGLAPHNLGDYINQQYRWARGSLEVIFKYNPLFRKGLTWAQKMQYLYSSGYYLNGVIVMIDAVVPLLALGFNLLPVKATTSDFMIYFFPFIFSTIYILMLSTKNKITFNSIQLSMSSFFVFFTAVFSTVLGIKTKFKVTSKSKESGNYLKFVIPHIMYAVISVVIIIRALILQGFVPSVVTNASWALFNIIFFSGYILVAYPWASLYAKVFKPAESAGKPIILEDSKSYVYNIVNSSEDDYDKE